MMKNCPKYKLISSLLRMLNVPVLKFFSILEMLERPYYMDYSPARLVIHKMVTSKYFDLAISAVIGLNVITMAMEFYMMPVVSFNIRNYKTFCNFLHFRS